MYTISIGISAFNEEKSIKSVIDAVLSQRQEGWKLREVLVYCDGCTDKTVEILRSIKSPLLKIHDDPKRKGKNYRVNQIYQAFDSDILVMFDADLIIKDSDVISQLIVKFEEKDVMLVGANSHCLEPQGFFQKAIYSAYYVYYKSREELGGGNNIFGLTGACMALRRKFAKELEIPKEIVAEDTFVYLSCIKKNYKFRYAKDAKVYFKLAENLKDYIKQILRTHPEALTISYKDYFGDLVKREFKRPIGFYIKAVLESFIKNPIGTIYMTVIKIACLPLFPFYSRKLNLKRWRSESTK